MGAADDRAGAVHRRLRRPVTPAWWPTADVDRAASAAVTEPNLATSPDPLSGTVSPAPLADDLRSDDGRDMPSRTDVIGRALSNMVGGPVGRHALIGRTRFMTPLRVMFIIALVFLAFGYTTKAACLQSTGPGAADQRVAVWENNRAYYEFCYSDTVPLYTAELLNLGKFPYKSSWIETDGTGMARTQYDGSPAIRYMEYPVLTGVCTSTCRWRWPRRTPR